MAQTISALTIYPVKSFGGLPVRESVVTARGLSNDRLYKLVDETGKFVTQRQYASLATLKTSFDGDELQIAQPDNKTLVIRRNSFTSETLATTVWRDTCQSILATDEINRWFSEFLNTPVRFVRLRDDCRRPTDPLFSSPGDEVSFADGFPILIVTTSSLATLPHFSNPINIERFRANIVVTATEPFAEDIWHHIKIGDVEFELTKPCSRCVVTTINQETGEKPSAEPITTLSTLRRGGKGVYFGQYAIPRTLGPIFIGDTVQIISTRPLQELLQPAKVNGLRPAISL